MAQPTVLSPAESSRVVQDDNTVVLIGQPPEILKNLLIHKIDHFDALLLTDIKEKDGSLLNNLEFPFYFFVFVAGGIAQGKKLTLIGEPSDISQALRLLRLTLMGPTRPELEKWATDAGQREEWLAVSDALAVKNSDGKTMQIFDFFETAPFIGGRTTVGSLLIEHTGLDNYQVSNSEGQIDIDLNQACKIYPPYKAQPDYVPGGLIKLGIEVLGGASGFTIDEPCTGLAVCHNGDYLLIDSIPFLAEHLFARGISKNQISALFLTHLHDDHCSMFPLMLMPYKVEVITTKEIFNMAMDKLACNLGWHADVVRESFTLVEITPGKAYNYYGLLIEPHTTVHSVPTIGATFSMRHKDTHRKFRIVGDNNSLDSIKELQHQGIVRPSTADKLFEIFSDDIDLLIADGGAGAIHGNPADALNSEAERVVFVHVDELPPRFSNTFSLANAGKRYTLFEGDTSIYMSQIVHYLSVWLGRPFPNRWMRSLLALEEIRRYNSNDVIISQGSHSRGKLYLILTGYCSVVSHDGEGSHILADLQAGDLIGEMAVITGKGSRNASVVAATPVSLCVFSEETFSAFIDAEGIKEELIVRWALRPTIRALPQFSTLPSTVLEKLGRIAFLQDLKTGETIKFGRSNWCILSEGEIQDVQTPSGVYLVGKEFGYCPLASDNITEVVAITAVTFLSFDRQGLDTLIEETPHLNYTLRKLRVNENSPEVDWLLGEVPIY